MRRALAAVTALLVLAASGCVSSGATAGGSDVTSLRRRAEASAGGPATCEGAVDVQVLIAQALPDAELVPCVDLPPADIGMGPGGTGEEGQAGPVAGIASVRRGAAWLSWTYDLLLVEVVATAVPDCDVDGATGVPSDVPGVQRYDAGAAAGTPVARLPWSGARGRSSADGPPAVASRTYVFEGGCVRLEPVPIAGGTGPVLEAGSDVLDLDESVTLDDLFAPLRLRPRDEVARDLRRETDGLLDLDPPGSA